MKESKKVILHLIVSEIKKGNGPAKISKNNNIKPQTLQYYLRQLRKDKVICKEGYGLWRVLKEVSKTSKATKQVKQIRGHAFNWRVRFKQEIDWKRRLKENNIKYQLIGINKDNPKNNIQWKEDMANKDRTGNIWAAIILLSEFLYI